MLKPRLRLLLSIGVLTLVVAAVALVFVERHQRTLAEHRNPSFKYEQQVLEAIYGNLSGSVTLACRSAIDSPPANKRPPINLDKANGLDGCRYQEQMIDN
jgi:cell division protein FtsL